MKWAEGRTRQDAVAALVLMHLHSMPQETQVACTVFLLEDIKPLTQSALWAVRKLRDAGVTLFPTTPQGWRAELTVEKA